MQNRLLDSLPAAELARLRPKLQPINLALGDALSQRDVLLDHIYFPETGMISLIGPLLNGAMVEVGVVGREGFVGVGVVVGADISIMDTIVRGSGSALSIPVAALRRELKHCPELAKTMQSFVLALLSQVAQTAACNARHSIRQRLARWLLMAWDRADSSALILNHESLAKMLGVRRAGITVALGKYRKAGLVRYSHGRIEILDRDGLEVVSCECYGQVKAAYKRLVPRPRKRR